MAEASFGYGEVNEFKPDYSGVDWREAYERRMDKLGKDLPAPAWVEAEDEDGSFQEQLTQENFVIYLNATNPDMDVITVIDPRDGAAIWWDRAKMGKDEFKTVLDSHRSEAMIIYTKYPLKMIAELIMKSAEVDVEHWDEGMPDGFDA